MDILAVGINHINAPLAVREALYFDAETLGAFLPRFLEGGTARGAVGLSTCNRLEFYLAAPEPETAKSALIEAVRRERPSAEPLGRAHYALLNEDAARHLFRVVSGIDSQVVGEDQIFAQVKRSYQMALDVGSASGALHHLFQHAFRVAKRARTETRIAEGNVSVASVAVSFIRRIFSEPRRHRALLIGAGETGEAVATHLAKQGVRSLAIANRTAGRAEALAARLGGKAVPFETVGEALTESDIVICATEASEPILTAEALREIMARRGGRLLAALDISVPRNIEPAADEIPQLFVYDLESLQEVCDENRRARGEEIRRVEAIVEEEAHRFAARAATLNADAVVRALRRRMNEIRAQELRERVESLGADEQARLERFSQSLLNKVLHDLTHNLRDLSRDPNGSIAELDALCRALRIEPESGDDDDDED